MFWYGSPTILLRSFLTQYFPPRPTFTANDIPPGSQAGRVFLITGANSGIGLELLKALYPTGARIWLACRSKERAEQAIRSVEAVYAEIHPPTYSATLLFLRLDLDDLYSVRAAAAALLSHETRLDVLFNIAGVGNVPAGTTTLQGLEAHIGINCVAPLLLTQELLPLLRSTATGRLDMGLGSVRVIWTSSLSMEMFSPAGGIDFTWLGSALPSVINGKQHKQHHQNHDKLRHQHPWRAYGASKCGNWFLARECARRFTADGIVSLAVNPGQLRTDAWKHVSGAIMFLMRPTMYEPRMGALPMLYAAFAPEVAEVDGGCYVLPWGRIAGSCAREDIEKALEGGAAERFWEWCESAYTRALQGAEQN